MPFAICKRQSWSAIKSDQNTSSHLAWDRDELETLLAHKMQVV